jgi:hypothetical protein
MRHLPAPLLLCLLLSCGDAGGSGAEAAVHAAWTSYDAAVRKGDLEELRRWTSAARAHELSAPDAGEKLSLAAGLRPGSARTSSLRVEGDRATLVLEAPAQGGTAKGTISLLKEAAGWRVDREDWSIAMAAAADPAPVFDPPRPMPAAVRALLDRIASKDPAEGAQAWTELSARYDRASAYLKDVHEGLEDPRPLAFVLVAESFTGGGRSFHYFTAKPSAAASDAREPVKTLGQALRYPLWQYENAGAGGFKDGFSAWWASYAAAKGLPR